jgi:hypothetical protein
VNKKTKSNLKRKTSNFFGAIGYFFTSVQWFWLILLYSSLITGLATSMSHETKKHVVEPTAVVDLGSSIPMIIITAVITFLMVALTIYILIKIPSTLVKASKKVVHGASENAAPMIMQVQNKKDTKKFHIKLTSNLIIATKIVFIIIPVILSFTSRFLEKQPFDFYLAMFVGIWLASLSLAFFVLQYVLAKILSVKRQDLI